MGVVDVCPTRLGGTGTATALTVPEVASAASHGTLKAPGVSTGEDFLDERLGSARGKKSSRVPEQAERGEGGRADQHCREEAEEEAAPSRL